MHVACRFNKDDDDDDDEDMETDGGKRKRAESSMKTGRAIKGTEITASMATAHHDHHHDNQQLIIPPLLHRACLSKTMSLLCRPPVSPLPSRSLV